MPSVILVSIPLMMRKVPMNHLFENSHVEAAADEGDVITMDGCRQSVL